MEEILKTLDEKKEVTFNGRACECYIGYDKNTPKLVSIQGIFTVDQLGELVKHMEKYNT